MTATELASVKKTVLSKEKKVNFPEELGRLNGRTDSSENRSSVALMPHIRATDLLRQQTKRKIKNKY